MNQSSNTYKFDCVLYKLHLYLYLSKMLKKFRRRDCWKLIGDAHGFINALNKLGINYKELRSTNQDYAEPNSIWD